MVKFVTLLLKGSMPVSRSESPGFARLQQQSEFHHPGFPDNTHLTSADHQVQIPQQAVRAERGKQNDGKFRCTQDLVFGIFVPTFI